MKNYNTKPVFDVDKPCNAPIESRFLAGDDDGFDEIRKEFDSMREREFAQGFPQPIKSFYQNKTPNLYKAHPTQRTKTR